MSMSLKVELHGRQFDLDPICEAVRWAFDHALNTDMVNAAKNCAEEVRRSPITDCLEQAEALLAEMSQVQWRHDKSGEPPVIVLTDPVYFDDPASHCD